MRKMIDIKHQDPVLRTYMLFMQLAHAANQYSDSSLHRSTRLKTATYVALKGLLANDGIMSHTKLAEWTNTRKHNITGLVDRMKREGLVTTQRSETDRRLVKIEITDKGRSVYQKAGPTAREIMQHTMRDLTRDDIAKLEKILLTMKGNLTKDTEK